jgi:hypothetical protein
MEIDVTPEIPVRMMRSWPAACAASILSCDIGVRASMHAVATAAADGPSLAHARGCA